MTQEKQQENKPIPVDGRKALTARDEDGLMLDQRRYLTALAEDLRPRRLGANISPETPSEPVQGEHDEHREPRCSDDQTVGVRDSDVEQMP